MAKLKAKDYQDQAINALLAIGGGSIITTQVVDKFAQVGDIIGKLPAELMGISVPLLISGYAALLLGKMLMK